ncbi:hypothetical protein CW304_29965 [Bacillus sp. UFRGS-B20]|nr:hypothetical protein CW304_29965 [Bacillus sp. UFRGS-B20]
MSALFTKTFRCFERNSALTVRIVALFILISIDPVTETQFRITIFNCSNRPSYLCLASNCNNKVSLSFF